MVYLGVNFIFNQIYSYDFEYAVLSNLKKKIRTIKKILFPLPHIPHYDIFLGEFNISFWISQKE